MPQGIANLKVGDEFKKVEKAGKLLRLCGNLVMQTISRCVAGVVQKLSDVVVGLFDKEGLVEFQKKLCALCVGIRQVGLDG